MKGIIRNIALALTVGALVVSCEKPATDDLFDTDTSSASDNSTSDNIFSGMFKSVSESADTSSNLKAGGCPTATVSPIIGWPRTVVIDFGTTGCNNRKGKIIAEMTGPFRTAGTTITITTQDYYDGLNKVESGTAVITNLGVINGHNTFEFNVDSAKVTTPGGVVSWSTDRQIQWVEGDTTLFDTTDDVFLVTGQASGVSSKGVSFTASITKELRIATACQWIESGIIKLTPEGKADRTIDFGNTGCDNAATVKIGDTETAITM